MSTHYDAPSIKLIKGDLSPSEISQSFPLCLTHESLVFLNETVLHLDQSLPLVFNLVLELLIAHHFVSVRFRSLANIITVTDYRRLLTD